MAIYYYENNQRQPHNLPGIAEALGIHEAELSRFTTDVPQGVREWLYRDPENARLVERLAAEDAVGAEVAAQLFGREASDG